MLTSKDSGCRSHSFPTGFLTRRSLSALEWQSVRFQGERNQGERYTASGGVLNSRVNIPARVALVSSRRVCSTSCTISVLY